jgi:hypothetical protein
MTLQCGAPAVATLSNSAVAALKKFQDNLRPLQVQQQKRDGERISACRLLLQTSEGGPSGLPDPGPPTLHCPSVLGNPPQSFYRPSQQGLTYET